MAKFDWTTESDPAWNEGEWEIEPPPPAPNRGSRWLMVTLLALLLIAGGYMAVREVQGRVADAEEAVRAEISSSYSLLTKAAAENDSELLSSLLSGRDVGWAEAQRELVSEGIWLPAPFYAYPAGYPAISPELSGRQLASIELSPDLREAVAISSFLVTTTMADGSQSAVRLQRPEVYRLGEQRWLLSKGDEAFWGTASAYRGELITLRYPARDKTTAVRLGGDLDLLLARMCRELADLGCADDLHIEVTLESDSESLLRARAGLSALDQGGPLSLPTISLVGVPVDEAGYQLLLQTYARRVATAVIGQQAAWRCCDHIALFQALVEYQLSQLELSEWPVSGDVHQLVFDSHGAIMLIAVEWGGGFSRPQSPEDRWRIYAFIDWLVGDKPAISPQLMLVELEKTGTFGGWLKAATGHDDAGNSEQSYLQEVESQWQLYALAMAEAGKSAPPIGYPASELWLVCQQDELREESAIYSFQVADDQWSLVLEDGGIPLFAGSLPGEEAFILSSILSDPASETEHFQMRSVSQQGDHTLFDGPEIRVSFGQVDPTNRYLVMLEADEDGQTLTNSLLDYEACANGNCDLIPIKGMPVWSPDGEESILVDSAAFFQHPVLSSDRMFVLSMGQPHFGWPLYRGDRLGQAEIGDGEQAAVAVGLLPFWIDKTTYGYVRSRPISSDSRDVEVVLASIFDDAAVPLINLADIRVALELEDPSTLLALRAIVTTPDNNGLLFILVTAEEIGEQYVLSYDIGSGEMQIRIESPFSSAATIGFSPDGRWLTAAIAGSSMADRWLESTLYLNHVADNRTLETLANYSGYLSVGNFDWSSDGKWLAVTSGRYATKLIAPDYDFLGLSGNQGRFCYSLRWMDR